MILDPNLDLRHMLKAISIKIVSEIQKYTFQPKVTYAFRHYRGIYRGDLEDTAIS